MFLYDDYLWTCQMERTIERFNQEASRQTYLINYEKIKLRNIVFINYQKYLKIYKWKIYVYIYIYMRWIFWYKDKLFIGLQIFFFLIK